MTLFITIFFSLFAQSQQVDFQAVPIVPIEGSPLVYTPAEGYKPQVSLYRGNFVGACVYRLKSTARRAARAARAVLKKKPKNFRKRVGDKFLHCSVSCKLTKKCGRYITFAIGVVKEVVDGVSFSGVPEVSDLSANAAGISYAKKPKKGKARACYSACTRYARSKMPRGKKRR